MDFTKYFFPNELVAQIVIGTQVLFFLYWIFSLLGQRRRAKQVSSEISNCEEIGYLSDILRQRYLQSGEASVEAMTMLSPVEATEKFEDFCKERKLTEKSPLYKHLRAIFFAGFNESQLNVEALIKTTTSRISSRNTSLRSFISLFIILGLFGTLFGLASSLSELSTILADAGQLNDEVLKNGLKTLLGKLGGAFAPSIWGVFFTIIGVGFFARYLNRHGFPAIQSLEHQTLINWVPNLIPTSSQRLNEKLILSERQLQKNFAAAEKVAEFAGKFDSKTSELGKNIEKNIGSLQTLSESAAKLGEYTDNFTRNLDGFAQNFKESVERLSPVTEGLTELYQKILDDSQKFQENVKLTVEDSQTFRGQVQEEFYKQTEQAHLALNSLKDYDENRKSVDEKIQATLSSAQEALNNLSRQNEVFIKALVETVGIPLRENLKAELVNVTESLNQINSNSTATLKEITANSTKTLDDFSKNVSGEIQSVATRLGQLHNPFENSATFMESTAKTFETRTQNFLEEIRREFQNQNQQKENENSNLVALNDGIQKLVGEINILAGKIEKLNQKNFSQPIYREKKKQGDAPQVFIAEPESGFFKRIVNRFRRKK